MRSGARCAAARVGVVALLALASLAWARAAPGPPGRALVDLPFERQLVVRDLPVLALLGVAALVAATLPLRRAPLLHPVAAGLLGFAALAWWTQDGFPHGPTLVTVLPHHGLTAGDLPGVAAMALGAALLASWVSTLAAGRRSPSHPGRHRRRPPGREGAPT